MNETTAPAPDLSIVIVSYAAAGFISACLDAIAPACGSRSAEVIVVDNASPDGTAEVIRRRHPEVRLHAMGENAGFARACNRGVNVSRARHVLFLNPDTVPAAGAFAALVEFLDDNPRVGVCAPRLLNTDGTDQGTARAFPTPAAAVFGRRSPLTRLFPNNRWSSRFLTGRRHTGDAPFPIDWVSGACLMAPRTTLASVGAFDEGFFMHFEDADLCRRIGRAGFEVWCVPTARVVHHEGGCRRGWPPSQVWHFHRGAYRYYSKHDLTGRRSALRPLAAAALAARGVAVLTRDRFLGRIRKPASAAP